MKCSRCQHENPPQAKFCLECGARVALTCTKCRSERPLAREFCLECEGAGCVAGNSRTAVHIARVLYARSTSPRRS